ncbi:MAG: hypothetical protein HOV80_08050 [Polyangiaceae bacterium]|nr:hypothetical protein [Polyangiaceae bacterium]
MKRLALPLTKLALFLTALSLPATAFADEDDEEDVEVEQEAKRKPKAKADRADEDDEDVKGAPRGADGEAPDHARFRGGVSGEAGAMIIPDSDLTLGIAGVQGQIGAQITHLVGVYWVPGFDIIFGKAGGVNFSSAVLVDFTFIDMISVGIGPDVGAFAAIGTGAIASGANYGGRLHFAVHPVFGRGDDGVRRKAFSIGIESRFLGGPVVTAKPLVGEADATVTGFIVQPMATIGYTAM